MVRKEEAVGEICPYCQKERLSLDPYSGHVICVFCGAYLSGNVLKRGTENTDVPHKSMNFAFSEIAGISQTSRLPTEVREKAYEVYHRAADAGLDHGRAVNDLAAASVYTACRICEMPRTIDEIAEAGNIGKKELGRTYRLLNRSLNLSLPPAKPEDYVQRYCAELHLDVDVWNMSLDILQKATEEGLVSGLGPAGIASAAVYLAANKCGEPRSQREVAETVGISEVTLRSRCRQLKRLQILQDGGI